jgi:small-conductance mechanosensitive channel
MPFKEILNQINLVYLLKKPEKDWNDDLIIYIYFLFFLYIIVKLSLKWIDRLIPPETPENVYLRRRYARRVYIGLSILMVFPVFYARLDFIPTFIGITGAAIIISTREMTLSLIAWFVIKGNEGFSVGDRIELDGVKGDVINIGVFRFSLLEVSKEHGGDQSTNRIVHFPNNIVILQKIFVVSQKMDYVWDELSFHVLPSSNIEELEELLLHALNNMFLDTLSDIEEKLREVSKNYLMKLGRTTPIVYTSFDNGKILVCLRYLTPVKKKRQNRSTISKEILKIMREHEDIKFS